MRLDLGGLVVDARSVGGVETCHQIPALDLCLDIGRCPPGAEHRGTLLLTHGHIDHAAGLPYYVSMRDLLGRPPPRIYCPRSAEPHLRVVLEAWTHLQASTTRCKLQGVDPGDQIPLRAGYSAHVFHAPHRIDCCGYGIVRRVRKLKPELQGLPEPEVAARARAGEAVQVELERPELCFPGDTGIEVVESEPLVRTSRVLLLECTFVGSDVTPAHARKGGHVHLDQIAERADLFENERIVLTHFSRRHSPALIREEVAKLPERLRARVELLLEDPPAPTG